MYARMLLISKLLHFKDFLSVGLIMDTHGDSRRDKIFFGLDTIYIYNKIEAILFDPFVVSYVRYTLF